MTQNRITDNPQQYFERMFAEWRAQRRLDYEKMGELLAGALERVLQRSLAETLAEDDEPMRIIVKEFSLLMRDIEDKDAAIDQGVPDHLRSEFAELSEWIERRHVDYEKMSAILVKALSGILKKSLSEALAKRNEPMRVVIKKLGLLMHDMEGGDTKRFLADGLTHTTIRAEGEPLGDELKQGENGSTD